MVEYKDMKYSDYNGRSEKRHMPWGALGLSLLALAVIGSGLAIWQFRPSPEEKIANSLQFDNSVSTAEQETIKKAIQEQQKEISGTVQVSVVSALKQKDTAAALEAYVPVTHMYATRQKVNADELAIAKVFVPADTDEVIRAAIAKTLGSDTSQLAKLETELATLKPTEIAFVPVSQLSANVKLLALDDAYYLDTFQDGAVFRTVTFTGENAANLTGLKLNNLLSKDTVLKTNMTGVTAFTREMLRKLNSVGDPKYFSQKIGPFLADADITHVSNEVSFKDNCQYHSIIFCSDSRFIEALQASGVDVVELTGNHNNDVGHEYNTATIKRYHELGWKTIGGGLNAAEAAKPYIADLKQSKVAFLAYNYPDSPNGGAIAKATSAGANSFDFDRIATEITSTKEQADFVIVNVQFWECYAYPDGYLEYPQCDGPIPDQKEVFRKLVDLGANMVIGSSAHQPQTYETYKNAPIYYGLGNLYFDQTYWPGTERGIVLTHYFADGKLLQTKLSPTVYHKELQTRLMDDQEAVSLLKRLNAARPN